MRYAKNASQYDFPEYVGKPRWYCLASSPRTGSSLCAEYFEHTGLAGRPLEYFHPKYQEDFSSRWAFGDKKSYICLLERWRTSPNGVFGVKCHFDQFMDFQTFVPENCRYLVIYRKNLLRQAISYFKSLVSQQWTAFDKAACQLREEDYDGQTLLQLVQYCQQLHKAWNVFLKQKALPSLSIAYEDLCLDRQAVLQKCADFLELDLSSAYAWQPSLKVQADELSEFYYRRLLKDVARVGLDLG